MRSRFDPGTALPPGKAAASAAAPRACVRVAILSDVRLVRDGLQRFLADRADLLLAATLPLSMADAEGLAAARPQVILVDVARAEPATVAARLRAACPGARLVTFALAEEDDAVFACAAAGFVGYVPQEGGVEEIVQAVFDAMDGRLRCAPHIGAALFGRVAALLQEEEAGAALPGLTPRESEILALADTGCSNKDIARRLTISAATVKNHMHNILQKLQVERRAQATARLRARRRA